MGRRRLEAAADGAAWVRRGLPTTGPGARRRARRRRVLERFFRGGAGAAEPGTGLGLAIVDVLARRWRGSVELRNRSVRRPAGGGVAPSLPHATELDAGDGLRTLDRDLGKSLPATANVIGR